MAGITLTSVDGLQVGQHTRADRPTGCTVVVAAEGASGGVAVRGSAPGTRETDLLDPRNSVQEVHGIVLSGGSAFGLATADGVVRCLKERGIGLDFPGGPIPIVPGAILFDLGVGGNSAPDADDGYAACAAASTDPVAQGNVGAGAGATVGKLFGPGAMKGGLGSAGYRFADGTVVAALVAVNCRGDVRDPRTGEIIAGARTADGSGFRNSERVLLGGEPVADSDPGLNTAIGVVATNRTLDKTACSRLAQVAHDGFARAIVPAHTMWDGDTLFFLATNRGHAVKGTADQDRLDVATAAAVSDAVVNAVRAAEGLPGLPSARDVGTA